LNLIRFSCAHFSNLSRSLWMASLPSNVLTALLSLVSSKLAEGALSAIVCVIHKDVEEHQSQDRPLRVTTCDQPPP